MKMSRPNPNPDAPAAVPLAFEADGLDATAAGILREAVASLDEIPGPRLGDFVRFEDGSLKRITVWRDGHMQAGAPENAGFFLWRGGFTEVVGFCGDQIDPARLQRLDESMDGKVWTFRNGDVQPGGRVDTKVPFRVYSYGPVASSEGLPGTVAEERVQARVKRYEVGYEDEMIGVYEGETPEEAIAACRAELYDDVSHSFRPETPARERRRQGMIANEIVERSPVGVKNVVKPECGPGDSGTPILDDIQATLRRAVRARY